jgi:hypothetical protein
MAAGGDEAVPDALDAFMDVMEKQLETDKVCVCVGGGAHTHSVWDFVSPGGVILRS